MLRNHEYLTETLDFLCKLIPIIEVALIVIFIILAMSTQ